MKKFIFNLILFLFFFAIICEIGIRYFHLAPDIPQREIDKHGIQKYKLNQSGYFTGSQVEWKVNDFGWLGVADTSSDTLFTIVGDSYIENIMNPIECHQGTILKNKLPNYSFFEAGRSGVSFIEAMEISHYLSNDLNSYKNLIYVSTNDFYESISELARYTDRLQYSVKNKKLLPVILKSPGLKKILYNVKLLYYLYIKYPIFVAEQNKGETKENMAQTDKFDPELLNQMLDFCKSKYNLGKDIIIFRPETDQKIIDLCIEHGFNTLHLVNNSKTSWELGEHDGHWSCYGHDQAGKQISDKIVSVVSTKKD